MPTTPLDEHWQALRACLVDGGASEDQLCALRVAFFCGAHAVFNTLGSGDRDAAMAMRHEVVAEWMSAEATSRRHTH